jgi:uncharacterized protein
MQTDFRAAIAGIIEREARPVEKFGHQPRLYALTQAIGQGMAYDDDVVYAAAWLHDLGVFAGHRPEDPEALRRWDHVAYACEHGPALLGEAEFPAIKVAEVLAAIRTHQPQDEPASLEGAILRDADILEQLGAVGVMRAVCKIGRDTRYPRFSDVAAVLKSALAYLPSRLKLDRARELAQPKVEALAGFLKALESEAGALLY